MSEIANENDSGNNSNPVGAITYLKIIRDVTNSLGLSVVVDYMERYDNPFEFLAKDVSPIFKIVGKLYKSVSKEGTLPLTEYASILSSSLTMVNSIIDLSEGIKAKTKTPADISAFVTNFASTCVTLSGSIFKLAKAKSPLVLPIVAASLGLVANTIATLDGVTESDVKKIDKSILGLATAMGTTYATAYFPGNKAIPAKLGAVSSIISGLLAGWDSFQTTVKKYEDNGIPSEIAVKDAAINAFANLIHGAASSYTYGADDTVFHFTQSIASWLTKSDVSYKDKNYMEWIVDVFKTLNVSNTGTSGDDTLINDTNEFYIYGEDGNDRISNFATGATIWGGSGKDTIFSHAEWEGTKFNSNSLLGGLGDDFISALDVMTTILGGDGNDKLSSYGNTNKICGEVGNDIILIGNGTNKNTINGGLGNDIVILDNAKNAIIEYSDGDGNDIIYGYEESDRINIDTNYETSISGDNVIIYVGTGLITLVGTANKTLNVNGKKIGGSQGDTSTSDNTSITLPGFWDSNQIVRGISINDKINNTVNSVKVNTTAGNDTITNSGSNVTIMSGADDDYISNSGIRTLIDGGSGVDVIYNEASNVTINGGDGNDSIKNIGNNVWIEDDGGNDTITNSGNYVSINSDEDNDRITNSGDNVRVNAGNGNNYVSNSGNNVTIAGGSSADTVISSGNYASINAGDGNNSISISSLAGGRNSIETGDGNDTINIADKNESSVSRFANAIDAGNGNNYIYNSNVELSTIYSGSGNDTIITSGGSVSSYNRTSIIAGNGDNKISVTTEMHGGRIYSGKGADYVTIVGNGSNNVVSVGGGDDTVVISGDSSTINMGSGNNRVTLKANSKNNKIIAGKGDDYIMFENNSDNNTVSIVGGINSIVASNGRHTIVTGDDSDLITVGSGYVSGGDGKNNISLTAGGNSSVITGKDNDTIRVADIDETEDQRYNNYINAGEGNNYICNSNVERSSITSGSGNDTIITGGGIGGDYSWQRTSINAGAGDNKITVNTALSKGTILTGNGNDFVSITGNGGSNVISLGGGRNTIYSGNGNYDYITSGNGGDVIIVGGNSNSINAGSGRNYVSLTSGNNTTVITGGGNDTIALAENSSGNVIIFGGGNDLVQNYHSNDIIKTVGSVTTSTVGNDVILTSDSDKMTLKGAKGKTINFATIAATGIDTTVGDTLTPEIAGQPQETLPPDETLEPDDSRLSYNAGKTAVTLSSDFTGTLNESGYASTTKTIDATKVSSGIKIYGNSLKNSIAGGTGNDTLIGGAGNDTLTGGSGKDIFVHSYGKDVITDYVAGTDKIKIEDGEVFDYRVTGSDVILYTDNGSVCVKNGKDKQITVIDEEGNETKETYKAAETVTVPANVIPAGVSVKGAVLSISTVFSGNELNLGNYDTAVTKVDASKLSKAIEVVGNTDNNSIKGGKGNDTINGGAGKDTIFGGNGNDVIYGGADNDVLKGEAGNDTLNGGSGNDTLTGGAGNDVFAYEGGNDVITDYKPNEDKIKLNLNAITSSSVKGSDVILTTSNGTLTVKGTKDKVITFVDDNGDTAEKIYCANYSYDPLVNGLTYDAKRVVLTASNKFNGTTMDLSEYLETVTKINASAVTQALNVVGNSSGNSIKGGKGSDTINGGAGKDTISGGTGNDSLYGGLDNDKLIGDAGNDTLNGGKGNDTLTGGAGNDVFAYEGGNDVITDYKPTEDKIKLNLSTITSSTVKGSDVILTTAEGTPTVKGAKDKIITFVDNNGNTNERIFFADTSYEPLETGLTYDAKRVVLTASNKFNGTTINLSEYLGTVTKINVSAVSQALNIKGNALANSIKGSKGNDIISGGDGKDTILGGTGNDSLYGGNDNDILNGEAGNDTLNGGKGNDTLIGGAGNDVFVYEGGNDVITDYAAGQDSIKVKGTISKVSYNGKNVIFSIGSGSLTVNNAKGKDITVTNSHNQTQTYSRTLDLLYDNNFMTDEFTLDSVADVSDTNYSVGQMEYVENNDEFTTCDCLVSASTFDDK